MSSRPILLRFRGLLQNVEIDYRCVSVSFATPSFKGRGVCAAEEREWAWSSKKTRISPYRLQSARIPKYAMSFPRRMKS